MVERLEGEHLVVTGDQGLDVRQWRSRADRQHQFGRIVVDHPGKAGHVEQGRMARRADVGLAPAAADFQLGLGARRVGDGVAQLVGRGGGKQRRSRSEPGQVGKGHAPGVNVHPAQLRAAVQHRETPCRD